MFSTRTSPTFRRHGDLPAPRPTPLIRRTGPERAGCRHPDDHRQQFLNEHIIEKARVHYAITDTGGVSPNVVQAQAEVCI